MGHVTPEIVLAVKVVFAVGCAIIGILFIRDIRRN